MEKKCIESRCKLHNINYDDGKEIEEVFRFISALQRKKGKVYGKSYCKHGDLSIFFNLERKWDRLENIFDGYLQDKIADLFNDNTGTADETFVDTIVDLTSYGLLWLAYIKNNHPAAFRKFARSNGLEVIHTDFNRQLDD